MWTNFKDVRSIAQKIGQVVAPPTDGDDDSIEEYYTEEEDDDEEDIVDYEEEGVAYNKVENDDNDKFEKDTPFGRNPFGIVNLIARALDDEQRGYDESHSNDNGVDGDGPTLMIPDDDEEDEVEKEWNVEQEGMESEGNQENPDHVSTPAVGIERTNVMSTSDIRRNPSLENSILSGAGSEFDKNLPPAVSSSFSAKLDLDQKSVRRCDSANISTLTAEERESEHDPEPARFGLVREAGSLSPRRSPQKMNFTTESQLKSRLKESTTVPFREESDGLDGAIVQPVQFESVENNHADSSPKEEESKEIKKPDRLRDALLGSLSDAKLLPLQAYSSEYSFDQEDVQDPGSMKPPRRLDSMMTEKEGNVKNLPHFILPRSPALETTNKSTEYGNSKVVSNDIVDKEVSGSEKAEIKRIERLEKRCKELKRQLVNAENHILELQRQNNTIVEQESSEHELLIQQFQEKEARLLQAATEEHEHEMNALRKDAEEKMNAMLSDLANMRDDRANMQKVLTDANARVDFIEQRLKDECAANEKLASQNQQQQVRALRMAEDKLVQTLAILDEREENIKQLKTIIKAMESKVTEQREGYQEAEEEMDELHNENEALHNRAEKLETECTKLRKQVHEMESDAERLVHLKVKSLYLGCPCGSENFLQTYY